MAKTKGKCPHCGKLKKNLKLHILITHPDSSPEPIIPQHQLAIGENKMEKGKKSEPPKPNSLNIYPRELGGIKFEYRENPVGYLQQSLNDNRWYHVHIYDKATRQLKALIFPDEKYYNPKELAQVIGAEPWRRFFERHLDLLEKISPWIFLGAIGIILLGLIIFVGG